eukprot:c47281_g1_i1.p2 GENE.c47281_g1_i1~~c47281_g1_i1.p2  ORF type:complete len:144 (-),score=17.76 c47281_g1_i1:154-585(-)
MTQAEDCNQGWITNEDDGHQRGDTAEKQQQCADVIVELRPSGADDEEIVKKSSDRNAHQALSPLIVQGQRRQMNDVQKNAHKKQTENTNGESDAGQARRCCWRKNQKTPPRSMSARASQRPSQRTLKRTETWTATQCDEYAFH